MKRLYCLILLFFFSCLPASAAWQEDFSRVYVEQGIDEAVILALAEGIPPVQIIREALLLEGLKQEILLKALFCALAQPETIRAAAKKNKISDMTIDKGYQLALNECRRQMEENLNSAIIQDSGFPQAVPPEGGEKPPEKASPWNFK